MRIQKKFIMHRNVGVQGKVFLVDGNGCIVFCEHKKMKQKEKERKTSKVDMLSS